MNVRPISQTLTRSTIPRRLTWPLLAALLLLSLIGVRPAYAAGLTVDSLADTIADDGACTLREAITNTNGDDQSGSTDCSPGSGADMITFSVSGTITLGSTLPLITGELTIDGAGQSVTVSGDNAYRAMVVDASGTLGLNALTIVDGFIDDANAVPYGGGVLNYGTLEVSNSTFSGNSGAAIYNYGGPVTITHSTIVGNSGGGLTYLSGSYTLYNSIVADNSGSGQCYNLGGTGIVTSDSYNIDSDGSCDNATTQTSAQLNLGSLADNGGETQTVALQAGSTAIDTGDDTTCTATDQRGVTRPQALHCDVGAFEAEVEVQPGPTFTVNTLDDHDDTFCTPDDCTLREAVNAANALSGADTITFSVNGTVTLGSTLPEITSEMTIDGAGQSVTVSGDNAYRVLLVNASGTLNLNALTIVDGLSGAFEDGGGILNHGALTVSNSTFSGNSAAASGGAIASNNMAIISNSTFSSNGNQAIFHSGINSGTMTVNNSTIAGNSGGIVYVYTGLTLHNTIIANNGTDCTNGFDGFLIADSNNIDSDGTCGDATTQTAAQLNLGSLADNGGETQTVALLAGSTAIDAGDDALCPATDQRGVARPQGANCDVGAFELEPVPNTAPIANPGGPYLRAINTSIQFDGSASSDPENNSLTYAWDFGDGSNSTGIMPTHSYGETGIYTVCLTVNDGSLDSDPACTIAVVYDPSSGFVTGGGWINSPTGAYTVDPSLTGKATFGFVSKYKKGASVPTGNTSFAFDLAGLEFHSDSYEWLVVNQGGKNAQFKGSGTINDGLDPNGNLYKFMLWAGDDNPDTFRIKIWWEDSGVETVVYDNGSDQPISGGNIVVHKGK